MKRPHRHKYHYTGRDNGKRGREPLRVNFPPKMHPPVSLHPDNEWIKDKIRQHNKNGGCYYLSTTKKPSHIHWIGGAKKIKIIGYNIQLWIRWLKRERT